MDGPGPAAAPSPLAASSAHAVRQAAVAFSKQAEKLSHKPLTESPFPVAIKARFVTQHDPVIIASDGSRLPGVPLQEARRLNILGETLQSRIVAAEPPDTTGNGALDQRAVNKPQRQNGPSPQKSTGGTLQQAMPPSHTNPLFPPLPLYGPPSMLRNIQCLVFQSSFFLSLAFLGVIVIGALFCKVPEIARKLMYRFTLRNIDQLRPFFEDGGKAGSGESSNRLGELQVEDADAYPPTEGGKDPVVCDVGYYARRVGLDVETFQVQTEDDFIITLWHVYDPKEYTSRLEQERGLRGPTTNPSPPPEKQPQETARRRRFPVLLMHGLLQSSGAYCCNDDESLAFWLCKSGFDVWLGNNRCGFTPKHTTLEYGDPRMWCWNIRQMGVFDLPALTSRVLFETGFEKLGLVCHSQGTAETFVALAKDQRPELGDRLTIFCALAPAAYAGPLMGKVYFKFMRIISPAMFRMIFGVHAFIPLMQMHALLPPRIYGWLGYTVFSFLFDWSDQRWDRGLRDRMFQFAPVYVSAESMRWWLGRECFAKHKCILATREANQAEEAMNALGEKSDDKDDSDTYDNDEEGGAAVATDRPTQRRRRKGRQQARDDLVDGQRLLRRFERGREPHVRIVHSKVVDDYEHLDVIWAMDAVDQVFCEIREVLWKTCHVRDACRVPVGCEAVAAWDGR